MTREKAEDEILERLDEIQQILDLWDPKRSGSVFTAVIERTRNYSRIAFAVKDPITVETIMTYDEDL